MATKRFCDKCGKEEKPLQVGWGKGRHVTLLEQAEYYKSRVNLYEVEIPGLGKKDLCHHCDNNLKMGLENWFRHES